MLNECSAGKDLSSGQAEPIAMGLDDCLEYIADDELVEVCLTADQRLLDSRYAQP